MDDGKETDLPDAERTLFSAYLSPKLRTGLKIDSNESDDEENNNGRPATTDLKLYKCYEENATYRIFEIKTGKLSQDDLQSDVSEL